MNNNPNIYIYMGKLYIKFILVRWAFPLSYPDLPLPHHEQCNSEPHNGGHSFCITDPDMALEYLDTSLTRWNS